MAFGYGYPQQPVYGQNYYGAAQDQLAQMRAPYLAQNQQPTQPQSNGLIWVQGEAGAKSYLVANGNSVLLMDSERQSFYIKSADASGMPSMRTFDYVERSAAPMPAQQPSVEYVTRGELNELAARVDELSAREHRRRANREVETDEQPVVS